MYIITYVCNQLQEEMIQKKEWTRKQLESMTEDSRKVYQKCENLQAENMQLSEQMKKLSVFNDHNVTLVNTLKAQARKLEQEKQNEVQIAKTEVCTPVGSFLYVSCMSTWFWH